MKAKEIKNLRAESGLTQAEFADLLGVSPKTVFNYEAGTSIPKPDVHVKILEFRTELINKRYGASKADGPILSKQGVDFTSEEVESFVIKNKEHFKNTPVFQLLIENEVMKYLHRLREKPDELRDFLGFNQEKE